MIQAFLEFLLVFAVILGSFKVLISSYFATFQLIFPGAVLRRSTEFVHVALCSLESRHLRLSLFSSLKISLFAIVIVSSAANADHSTEIRINRVAEACLSSDVKHVGVGEVAEEYEWALPETITPYYLRTVGVDGGQLPLCFLMREFLASLYDSSPIGDRLSVLWHVRQLIGPNQDSDSLFNYRWRAADVLKGIGHMSTARQNRSFDFLNFQKRALSLNVVLSSDECRVSGNLRTLETSAHVAQLPHEQNRLSAGDKYEYPSVVGSVFGRLGLTPLKINFILVSISLFCGLCLAYIGGQYFDRQRPFVGSLLLFVAGFEWWAIWYFFGFAKNF